MPALERQILTVSQLNRQARQLLETHLSLVWIEGEISNLAQPASGHCYFSLKDTSAQIRCAMFKNRRQYSRVAPANGMKVLIRGRVSLYEGRGDYQLIVEHMEDAGLGALQRAFEALRDKLEKLGLFSAERKRPLPKPAKHIAIITSRTGAALQDILSVFERRWPGQPLTLIPATVQGSEAAPQLIRAIELANRANCFDVILLARGGGSLEDLWAFNDEDLAHAIVQSQLPIITGVGHETDTTIADFAADMRAPTPSAAAEMLSPSIDEWASRCSALDRRLGKIARSLIAKQNQQLQFLSHRLRRCQPRLDHFSQALDLTAGRLYKAANKPLADATQRLTSAQQRLTRLHPSRQLALGQARLKNTIARLRSAAPIKPIANQQKSIKQLEKSLHQLIHTQLEQLNARLAHAAHNLDNLSPLQTLKRGYALATDVNKSVITNSRNVNLGDTVEITLAQGRLTTTITGANHDDVSAPKS